VHLHLGAIGSREGDGVRKSFEELREHGVHLPTGAQWQPNGNQWQSMAINGNQWQSMAINGNQWQSMAIKGNPRAIKGQSKVNQ
jgi:hypothetical protein